MLSTLFLDLNSYFASVEQQLRPELRGKPVAVVPVLADTTCCIAASYPAKRFGIRTGTLVGEARRLCPELTIVLARPELYVDFHHRIIEAIETCLPIARVHSIDEVSCKLGWGQRGPDQAFELAHRVKQAIAQQVGAHLRSSIGIAPNRFLAKIASNMVKPDGLVVIEKEDLPECLFDLDLRDLPGVGPKMHQRLVNRGVDSVKQLCSLSSDEMERIWESIMGPLWWRLLRGEVIDEEPTHRRSIGHQHVLPPQQRNSEDARAVVVRLLHKAAMRLRNLHYAADRLTLWIRPLQGPSWKATAKLPCSQDTIEMAQALARLWEARPQQAPLLVGVTLHDLVAPGSASLPLFEPQRHRRELSMTMDRLNAKFKRNMVYPASMHASRGAPSHRIAFQYVPDTKLPV